MRYIATVNTITAMDLFLVGRADIFAIYPKIFQEILQNEEQSRRAKDGYLSKDHVLLPSDADFQDRVYYRLLAVQRAINEQVESGISLEEIAATKEKHLWDPEVFSFSNHSSPIGDASLVIKRRCRADNPLDFLNPDFLHEWQLDDLIKAAKLLRPKTLTPLSAEAKCVFLDEHEMRRVYSIIYDVFRYKHVINKALQDISFFTNYPELEADKSRTWLLVYDLHLRNFENRESQDNIRQEKLYEEADVQDLHKRIWKHKINLAASLSRLRIQNGALLLSQLLPIHLQDDKVAVAAAVSMVTGWINPFKLITKTTAIDALLLNGLQEARDNDEGETALLPNHFKWDKVCPLFAACVPPDRGHFSQTLLVRDDQFILQDRAFTYGPAVFCRLLGYFDIEGDIVQTHVSSPRSTAYLAALVHNNTRVHEFLAFGAGSRVGEYRSYLEALGCPTTTDRSAANAATVVRIFAENYCDYAANAKVFERVVGVFCTPPNSYSGVTDPIDLICSRGGDLTMLEVLTESEMSDASKRRVAQILEQQRETLRLALARPQVQFCLYETHSVVEAENEAMVRRAVELMNRCAHAKHVKRYKEKRRMEMLAEIEGVSVEQLEKLQAVMGSTPASVAAKKKLRELEAEEARGGVASAVAAAQMSARGGGGGGESDHSAENSGNEAAGDEDSENETLETSRSRMSKQRSNGATPTPQCGPHLAAGEFGHLKIPKTDLFEVVPVPDVCTYQDQCVKFGDTGCFLSLIKRKRVTRMDEKYLIVMAERRGLFGDTNPKRTKAKQPLKNSRKEEMLKKKQQQRRPPTRLCRNEDMDRLIDRLLMPTYAVSRQYFVGKKSLTENTLVVRRRDDVCGRDCCGMLAEQTTDVVGRSTMSVERSMYKMWWFQAVRYIRDHRVVDWSSDEDNADYGQKALVLQRKNLPRGQYRCVKQNIVFKDNKSI